MNGLQPWKISELSLTELLRAGKKVGRDACQRELRIGILGDCATQHYSECVTAAFRLRGFWPIVYEAEYDAIRLEIADQASGLFRHKPEFVIVFNCIQKLEEQFARTQNIEGFARNTLEEITSVWDTFAKERRQLHHSA